MASAYVNISLIPGVKLLSLIALTNNGLSGIANVDDDAEIFTGAPIVEDTQDQTSPKPSSSEAQLPPGDKLEIPETEDQRNVMKL